MVKCICGSELNGKTEIAAHKRMCTDWKEYVNIILSDDLKNMTMKEICKKYEISKHCALGIFKKHHVDYLRVRKSRVKIEPQNEEPKFVICGTASDIAEAVISLSGMILKSREDLGKMTVENQNLKKAYRELDDKYATLLARSNRIYEVKALENMRVGD